MKPWTGFWLLLLLGTAAVAQPAAREVTRPYNGADEILIYTPDSGRVALPRMVDLLRRAGFEMDTVLATFALTLIRPIPAAFESAVPATVWARVRIRPADDGTTLIRLDGYCLADSRLRAASKVMADEASYVGGRRGVQKAAFRLLQSVALAYPNGRVIYRQYRSLDD